MLLKCAREIFKGFAFSAVLLCVCVSKDNEDNVLCKECTM